MLTYAAHVLDESLCTIPYTRQITYTCVVTTAAEVEMLRKYPLKDGQGQTNNRLYHLMGDPSLHVWTADSGDLLWTFAPLTIPAGQTCWVEAWVRHASTHEPVVDAPIGLYKPGDPEPEVLQYGRTDVSGHASLLVCAPTPGTMTITASKPLFHGVEGFIGVVEQDSRGNEPTGGQGVEAVAPRRFGVWATPVCKGRLRVRAEVPKAVELRLGVYDATGKGRSPRSWPLVDHWGYVD
jgi:hypothetical protein